MTVDVLLPRVIIRKGKNSASIKVNFQKEIIDFHSDDQNAQRLLELADDWTSFGVATLQFVPSMSSAGFMFLDFRVEEELFIFLKKMSISKEESEDPDSGDAIYSFIIHEDDLNHVCKKMETTTQMIRAASAVNRSAIGLLMAEFDYFMVRLLEICSEIQPKSFYNDSDKFTLGEINSFGGIDTFIKSRIQKTIQDKGREGHVSVIDWIFSEFNLSQTQDFKSTDTFKKFAEACQRRHILMHNGGIINELYLQNCSRVGIDESELGKIGDLVEIDQRYIKSATARVYETGFYIIHILFQKTFSKSCVAAYINLLTTSHSFLEGGFTKMARRVCDFAEKSEKKFTNELRLKFGINRALSYLFDPSLTEEQQNLEARKILQKYDWSVTTPLFKLALTCVNRDFSDLIETAKAAAADGLNYTEARTWVVFREAREIDGFLACFPRSPLQIAGPSDAIIPPGAAT